jgi:Ring finger domain
VIDAAALQDQLMRRMNGCFTSPLTVRRVKRNAAKPSAQSLRTASAPSSARVPVRRASAPPADPWSSATWACESCTLVNTGSNQSADIAGDRCIACEHPRQQHRPRGGRRASLNLAQIRGFEQRPPEKLTAEQWTAVESASDERGDSAAPCPICREHFRCNEEQVILNCSHQFHRACLNAFERFLRSSARTCPLCRHANYRKRSTKRGAQAWKQRCLLKLQSVTRGFLVR